MFFTAIRLATLSVPHIISVSLACGNQAQPRPTLPPYAQNKDRIMAPVPCLPDLSSTPILPAPTQIEALISLANPQRSAFSNSTVPKKGFHRAALPSCTPILRRAVGYMSKKHVRNEYYHIASAFSLLSVYCSSFVGQYCPINVVVSEVYGFTHG